MNKRITLLWLFEQSDKQDFWIVLKVQGEMEKCLFFPLFCLRSLNSTGDPSPQAPPQLKGYRLGGVKLVVEHIFFSVHCLFFLTFPLSIKVLRLKLKSHRSSWFRDGLICQFSITPKQGQIFYIYFNNPNHCYLIKTKLRKITKPLSHQGGPYATREVTPQQGKLAPQQDRRDIM